LPASGLPIASFRGLASRDGMARALAARLSQPARTMAVAAIAS
jgi:hypothetical protein